MRLKARSFAVGAVLLVAGCNQDKVFTLYRNSLTLGGEAMRIHFATFDADGGKDYNRQNCEVARCSATIRTRRRATIRDAGAKRCDNACGCIRL